MHRQHRVDAHCHVGAPGELAESLAAFTPQIRAAQAYDPFAPGWEQLLRRGVTTVLLAPTDNSLAGGTAVLQTIFPGAPEEMLTVHYTDGDQLVATHYCMLGNQILRDAQRREGR